MKNHEHKHQFSYDEATRRRFQNPEKILKSIVLREGMVFIDLGCNDGFFSIPAAKLVTKTGYVVGVDIDDEALHRLETKAQTENIDNISTIHSAAETVVIKEGVADFVFLGTVLHDFNDPVKVLKNAKEMLKENGLIYNYDWQKIRQTKGPPYDIRFSKEHVEQLALESGLVVVSSTDINKSFYGIFIK